MSDSATISTTSSPRTTWPQRLLLLAVSTALGLLLLEGIVWVAKLAPEVVLVQQGRFRLSPNPKIGYEPVPFYQTDTAHDSFNDHTGSTNSLGFRDVEHEVVKTPGTSRILILGDSVSVGQGVPKREQTWPAIVNQRLQGAGLPIELLNFAVTGYNTQQEVWTLHDKGLVYQPDLVLVGYCLNDRKRSDGGVLPTLLEQEKQAEGVLRHRAHPLFMHSGLYRMARYRLAASQQPTPTIYGDTVDESFEFLAELQGEHGFQVLLVVFPRFGKLLNYRFPEEHARMEALAQRLGFHYLDLLPAIQQCRRDLVGKLAFDSYHPTPMGHGCAGEEVSRYLTEHRSVLGL